MPIYVYKCAAGHVTEAQVKLDGSDAPTRCDKLFDTNAVFIPWTAPRCDKPLEKQITAPGGFPGAANWRGG